MTSKPYWPRVWELFDQVLELPPAERSVWLREKCGDDDALLKELEGLLSAHQTNDGVLERSVQPLAAEALCEPREITTGQQIGPYRILAEIGRGGMGVVYKAEDTRLERTVALKFLVPHLVADPEIRERFTREAKAAANLNHPNICTVYEIEEIEGRTFISMAYIDGVGLDSKIKQGPMKLTEALEIAAQTGEGLAEAHSQGIVHRDVKPGNIMVRAVDRPTSQAIITDFGLARLVRRSTLTRVGTRVGTVCYMSPEQTEGSKVDNRSDIWALGVVLYEMICGLPPFRGEYDEAVLYSILNEDPEPLTSVRSGLPVELDWVVAKALAKSSEERYQNVEELVTDLRRLAQQVQSGRYKAATPRLLSPLPGSAPTVRTQKSRLAAWVSALVATAVLSALITWWVTGEAGPAESSRSSYGLTRITRDSGLATTPALSPDGSLVAFASDRAGEENLDIWLQQTALGGAVRLTSGEADEHAPAFSPDGSRIAFRAEGDNDGIYSIPVLGGEPRLIVRNGRGPVFSPDGDLLAYYVAAPGTFDESKLFVVAPTGGMPRPLQSELDAAAMPVWTPGGEHVVFWGKRDNNDDFDLWVVSRDGEQLIEMNATGILAEQSLRLVSLDGWSPDGNYVIFSAEREHSVNLWRVPIDTSRWQAAGPAENLTFGVDEREATLAAGDRFAFTSATRRVNIWSLPLDSDGLGAGPLEPLTDGDVSDIRVDASADGSRLVFRSNRSGSGDIWLQELPSGNLRELTATSELESVPRLTRDGRTVAFSVINQGRRQLYLVPAAGGSPEQICDDCGSPLTWSLDGTKILYLRVNPAPAGIYEFDIKTRERRPVIEHPEIPVYVCQLSADGKWLVFKGDLGTMRTRVYVAPMPEEGTVPPDSWIPITGGDTWDDLPRMSADGRTIYFFSHRDGSRCIWARRFDPVARQPEGEVFPIHHLHQVGLSVTNLSLAEFELAVTPDRLIFPLAEISGNIWMMSPVADTQ